MRVLLVEDSSEDAELLEAQLRSIGYAPAWERVETESGLRSALARGPWDLVVSDFSMPAFNAMAALAVVRESGLDLPFLIVSGTIGEETAVTALKAGAHDFLVKGRLARLGPAIERELREAEGRRARARVEEALRFSDDRFRAIIGSTGDGVLAAGADGNVSYANPAAVRLFGYAPEALLGRPLRSLVADGSAADYDAFVARVRAAGGPRAPERTMELSGRRSDGTELPVELSLGFWDVDGVSHVAWIARDLTDRVRLEAQVREWQKMEAIGVLAGGIAHDFNNLLTAILGNGELALASVPAESAVREHVEEMLAAGERAATLTRQLLAFGSRQVLQAVPLDLNAVVLGLEKMLTRLIGEDFVLATELDPALGSVEVDPGQIEQVIVNLVVNARDAMPRGGRLTIRTGHRDELPEALLDTLGPSLSTIPAHARAAGPAGSYVYLEIADTGVGMDDRLRERIFEPFFTTKAKGKGTGLGLSTVYGIVRQSGGFLEVESVVGSGSTFRIYLPRVDAAATAASPERPASAADSGPATILLVEDNLAVRSVARRMLANGGYTVLEAGSGKDALVLSDLHPGRIDLLLTDTVMPEMSGPELARELSSRRRDTSILFMSGFTDEAVVQHGLVDEGWGFLQKPFSADALMARVREMLRPATPASRGPLGPSRGGSAT